MKTKLRNQKGFTIIEVLIVLAIAGLILLIVFLAVPALQRNQRNTSRKNDVARVGGAATEYVSNNNGTLPSTAADNTTILTSAGNLSQYTAASPLAIATSTQPALNPATQLTNYRIVTGARCGASGATVGGGGTSARAMAIQYVTETGGGGGIALCQDI